MKHIGLVKSLLITLIVFCLSCNGSTSINDSRHTSEASSDLDSTQLKSFVYTKYNLPLSVEIFKLLKSKGVDFNKLYLLNTSSSSKYFTDEKVALALGVYTSDLAYSTVNDKSQEVIGYFDVSGKMANKLEIEDGYDNKLLDRANENIDNNDSLNQIAKDAYMRTCNYLYKNNKTNILPLIIMASWIESVHILAKSSIGSDKEKGLYEELYIQKQHLENLIKYLNDVVTTEAKSEFVNDVNKWKKKLESLQLKFNEIQTENTTDVAADKLQGVIMQIEDIRLAIIE